MGLSFASRASLLAVLASSGATFAAEKGVTVVQTRPSVRPGPVEARPAAPAFGRRFWVTPRGSDANDCTQRAPCREIQRALRFANAPGDVVLVLDGRYHRFTIDGAMGTPERPITIFALGKNAVVEGDRACTGKPACRDNVLIQSSRHVVIDGLGSRGAPRAGFSLYYGGNITIRNADIADNGRWGIFSTFVDDLVVEKNDIHGTRRQHGIYLSNSGDRPTIRENDVHDNDASGIQINADFGMKPDTDRRGKSLYDGPADGITTGAVIEKNLVRGNGWGRLANDGKHRGAAVNLDGVQDSVVNGNLLYDNGGTGIVLYGDEDGIADGDPKDGDGREGPKGVTIEQNIVVMPSGSRSALQVRLSVGPNFVRNNILLHRDARRAGLELVTPADARLVESDANVLDTVSVAGKNQPLAAWKKQWGKDRRSSSVPITKLFVDPFQGDFTLRQGAAPIQQRGLFVGARRAAEPGQTRPAAAP